MAAPVENYTNGCSFPLDKNTDYGPNALDGPFPSSKKWTSETGEKLTFNVKKQSNIK